MLGLLHTSVSKAGYSLLSQLISQEFASVIFPRETDCLHTNRISDLVFNLSVLFHILPVSNNLWFVWFLVDNIWPSALPLCHCSWCRGYGVDMAFVRVNDLLKWHRESDLVAHAYSLLCQMRVMSIQKGAKDKNLFCHVIWSIIEFWLLIEQNAPSPQC